MCTQNISVTDCIYIYSICIYIYNVYGKPNVINPRNRPKNSNSHSLMTNYIFCNEVPKNSLILSPIHEINSSDENNITPYNDNTCTTI